MFGDRKAEKIAVGYNFGETRLKFQDSILQTAHMSSSSARAETWVIFNVAEFLLKPCRRNFTSFSDMYQNQHQISDKAQIWKQSLAKIPGLINQQNWHGSLDYLTECINSQ